MTGGQNPWLEPDAGPADAPAEPTVTADDPIAPPRPVVTPSGRSADPTAVDVTMVDGLPRSVGSGPPAGRGDPHGLAAVARHPDPVGVDLAYAGLAVAAVSLVEGEQVRALVHGCLGTDRCVAVLTDERVLFVVPSLWSPQRFTILIGPGVTVAGWVDGSVASLTFQSGAERRVVEQITDTAAAVAFAEHLRAAVAERSST